MTTTNLFPSSFAAYGYSLTFGTSSRTGEPTAMAFKGKSLKPVFHFRFKNEDKRDEYLQEQLNFYRREQEKKDEQKIKAETAKSNFVNPYTIGQVLCCSWGYEQTNIDFYQVIEVGKMSIKVKEIGAKIIPSEGLSSMAGMVTPVIDSFMGEVMTKIIRIAKWDAKPYIAFNERRNMYVYEKGDKGLYCSWYA